MERKAVSGIMLTLLFIGISTLVFNIQPVKAAGGTVFIRADGSVDPPTVPISTVNNVTYTFTDNINDSIVIERNNIIVDGAGYTVQGDGSGNGIDLSSRSNVTIKNMKIKAFDYGVYLEKSSANSLYGNNITNNSWQGIWVYRSSNNGISKNNITNNNTNGIWLYDSSNNNLTGNNITNNNGRGIWLCYSSNNIISGNNITNNSIYGIDLYDYSSNNIIIRNNIINNRDGVSLYHDSSNNIISENNVANNSQYGITASWFSSNNVILHNNFINNTNQAYRYMSYGNVWDDGYPSGGNYWSDYTGVDFYHGPYQNITGSDGIGDTPYTIDENNQDCYPLMNPWTPPPPEVHDVAVIGVVPSATEVYVGRAVNITVIVRNEGNVTETLTLTCKYELEGAEHLIGTQAVSSLAPNTDATVTFAWTTTDITVHTIKAEIPPLTGETDTIDNTKTSLTTVKVKMLGDINGDNTIDILDVIIWATSFGTEPRVPGWNPQADLYHDNIIDIFDGVIISINYGKTYP